MSQSVTGPRLRSAGAASMNVVRPVPLPGVGDYPSAQRGSRLPPLRETPPKVQPLQGGTNVDAEESTGNPAVSAAGEHKMELPRPNSATDRRASTPPAPGRRRRRSSEVNVHDVMAAQAQLALQERAASAFAGRTVTNTRAHVRSSSLSRSRRASASQLPGLSRRNLRRPSRPDGPALMRAHTTRAAYADFNMQRVIKDRSLAYEDIIAIEAHQQMLQEYELVAMREQEAKLKSVVAKLDMKLAELNTVRQTKPATGRSLFCLTVDNPLRLWLLKLVQSDAFENFTLAVIVVNCVFLALNGGLYTGLFYWADLAFVIVFTIEAALKIPAFGFLLAGSSSYLRDPWNILDFVVVVMGIIGLFANSLNATSIRAFRLLRPLRAVNKLPGMRVMVTSMLASMASLVDMMFLLIFLLLVFGLLGMQLFSGKLRQQCFEAATGAVVDSDERCGFDGVGRSCPADQFCAVGPDNPNFGFTSFDNLPIAALTLIQAISLEGWTEIMYRANDVSSNLNLSYFVLLILVGSLFVLNLVVEVISARFEQSKKADLLEEHNRQQVQRDLVQRRQQISHINHDRSERLRSFLQGDRSGSLVSPQGGSARVSPMPAVEQELDSQERRRRDMEQLRSPLSRSALSGSTSTGDVIVGSGSRVVERVPQHRSQGLVSVSSESVTAEPSPVHTSSRRRTNTGSFDESQRSDVELQPLSRHAASSSFDARDTSRRSTALDAGSSGSLSNGSEPSADSAEKQAAMTTVKEESDESENSMGENENSDSDVVSDGRQAEKRLRMLGVLEEQGAQTEEMLTAALGRTHSPEGTVYVHGVYVPLDELKWWQKWIILPVQLVVMQPAFRRLVALVVVANTLVLALDHHDESDTVKDIEYVANFIFTQIFLLEMILNMIGLGLRRYFKDELNWLDALIVIMGELELILSVGQGISILRAFRLLRVFKMMRQWKKLRRLMKVVLHSAQDVMYYSLLVLLFMFIYATLGMELFRDQFVFDGVRSRTNFDDFWFSFIAVFQILTGEGWNEVMWDGMRGTNHAAAVYFVSLFILGTYIVLSLFLAILVGKFAEVTSLSDLKDREEQHLEALNLTLADDATRVWPRCGCCRRRLSQLTTESWEDLRHEIDDNLDELPHVRSHSMPASRLSSGSKLSNGSARRAQTVTTRRTHPHSERSADGSGAKRDAEPTVDRSDSRGSSEAHEHDGSALAPEDDDVDTQSDADTSEAENAKHAHPATVGSTSSPSFRETDSGVARRDGETTDDGVVKGPDSPDSSDEESTSTSAEESEDERDPLGADFDPARRTAEEQRYIRALTARLTPQQMSRLHAFRGQRVPDAKHERRKHKGHHHHVHKEIDDTPPQESSLFIFGPDNRIRRQAQLVVGHRWFDRLVLLVILFSCVLLTLDTPDADLRGANEDSTLAQFVRIGSQTVAIFFLLEVVLKVIALGFILHPGSYARSPWNVLDFFITILAVADMLGSKDFKFVRGFRALRGLRPLRLISRVDGIKGVAGSVANSLSSIGSLSLVALVFFLIFAILGVQFFKGSFRSCQHPLDVELDATLIGLNKQQCEALGMSWANPRDSGHFDNVPAALMLLFEVASLEQWPVVMWRAVDATASELPPEVNHNLLVPLYFMLFIAVCSFFLSSLFVGVVVNEFKEAKLEAIKNTVHTSPELTRFLRTYKLMAHVRPARRIAPPTERIFGFSKDTSMGRCLRRHGYHDESDGEDDETAVLHVGTYICPFHEAMDDDTKYGRFRHHHNVGDSADKITTLKYEVLTKMMEERGMVTSSLNAESRFGNTAGVAAAAAATANTGAAGASILDGPSLDDGAAPSTAVSRWNTGTSSRSQSFPNGSVPGGSLRAERMSRDELDTAAKYMDVQDLQIQSHEVMGWELWVRWHLFRIVQQSNFEVFIAVCIFLNTVAMAMSYEGMSDEYEHALDIVNLVFSGVFILEMLAKWTGLGIRQYFKDRWNQFDFMVVVLSVVAFTSEFILAGTFRFDPAIFRALRVLRIVRLVKRASGLRQMIETILKSLPALVDIALLLFLLFYIYACIGMALFGEVKFQSHININANFRTFLDALLLLFRCSTGESWNALMHDCMVQPPLCEEGDPVNGCGSPVFAVLFFVSFVLINAWFMMKLFVAVVFKNFESGEDLGIDDENLIMTAGSSQRSAPPPVSREQFEEFSVLWSRYTDSEFLPVRQLGWLINHLPPPLGFQGREVHGRKMIQLLFKLDLPHHQGRVHFLDVMYKLTVLAFEGYLHGQKVEDILLGNSLLVDIREEVLDMYPRLKDFADYDTSATEVYAALVLQHASRQWKAMRRRRRGMRVESTAAPARQGSMHGSNGAPNLETRREAPIERALAVEQKQKVPSDATDALRVDTSSSVRGVRGVFSAESNLDMLASPASLPGEISMLPGADADADQSAGNGEDELPTALRTSTSQMTFKRGT